MYDKSERTGIVTRVAQTERSTVGVRRGTQHHNNRLDEQTVYAIRKCIGLSYREMSRAFGVSIGHISKIRNGRLWSHLP